jgi:hypothetical protein
MESIPMQTEDKSELYVRLNYTQYKQLEAQLRDWDKIESSHTSVEGYYHKALRLEIGSLVLEIQGPTVKQPLKDRPPGHENCLPSNPFCSLLS